MNYNNYEVITIRNTWVKLTLLKIGLQGEDAQELIYTCLSLNLSNVKH